MEIVSDIMPQALKNYSYFLNGFDPNSDTLVKNALEDFRDRSGLTPDILEEAQVKIYSENTGILKKRLGFNSLNGQAILKLARLVEIPSFLPDGSISEYHYRTYPPIEERRYLHSKGRPAKPYILPKVWSIKDKPHKPLWITEGAKKALKLIQHGRLAIGLQGVWNFRTETEPFLFEALESFTWKGRTVYLAFDIDLWTNPQVRFALFELTLKLISRGAVIRFVTWEGAKGIDDLLVSQDNPENTLLDLEKKAKPIDKFILRDHRDELVRALKLTHSAFDSLGLESIVRTIAKKLDISTKGLFAAIAHKNEKAGTSYTEEDNEEALKILKAPKLVERFLDACHSAYLGRDKTLILVKLATLTRHLKRGLSVVLSGTSSVGKSALIETVLKTCDPSSKEDFSRISAQYLLYREEDLSHKVITFYELNGTNSSAEIIRTAITEGELKLGTVQKNAQGALAATEIEKDTQGLVFLSTFTGSRVDPELATRVLLQEITHNESLARKVYKSKAKGIIDTTDVLRLWRIADSLLEARPVSIPYLVRLADLFPTSEERFHRDFDKTVMLIKASALFHQYQRECTEDGHIIAIEDDYRLVYYLSDSFTQSILPISVPVLNMLTIARGMEEATRAELQNKTGVSSATIKRYISQAIKGGYITAEGRGQSQIIRVLEIPEKRSILPTPKNIFQLFGEPLSQTTQPNDISEVNSAQALLSQCEPFSQPDDTHTAQIAQSGSIPCEPNIMSKYHDVRCFSSTTHDKDKYFISKEVLPEVEVLT